MNIDSELGLFFSFLRQEMPAKKCGNVENKRTDEKMSSELISYFNFLAKYNKNKTEDEPQQISEKIRLLNKFYEFVEKRGILPESTVDIQNYQSYFCFINMQGKENFYSDNIAALFNTSVLCDFPERLLLNLINHIKSSNPFNEIKSEISGQISARREVSLSEFSKDKELEKKRIDILITTGNLILIIENKTETSEHDNQTEDYYKAVSDKNKELPVYGLFLTTNGETAKSKNFTSINYCQLLKIINSSLEESSIRDAATSWYITFFLKEMNYILFNKTDELVKKAKEFRRKNE